MELWFERLMWVSIGMVLLVTAGYPLFLASARLVFRRQRRIADAQPSVTLIIAAHNEEVCIGRKLENSLALEYPRELLEIVVASDGSADRTAEIVESYGSRGVKLHAFPRMGKTGVQNRVLRNVISEICVFSDANAMYRPEAIQKLVRNFADPSVACVCGQLIYQAGPDGAAQGERSYWNYEKFIKRC
jgi:biofilm PGA synthesis N-glycosyltransferase PgaC